MGGEFYAVCSDDQQMADKARTRWGLSFECLGDPENTVAAVLARRGILKLAITPDPAFPHGVVQPGVYLNHGERCH
jgi:hypothetical protein